MVVMLEQLSYLGGEAFPPLFLSLSVLLNVLNLGQFLLCFLFPYFLQFLPLLSTSQSTDRQHNIPDSHTHMYTTQRGFWLCNNSNYSWTSNKHYDVMCWEIWYRHTHMLRKLTLLLWIHKHTHTPDVVMPLNVM